jgi:riboflavin synthase
MFTGIVREIGTVEAVERNEAGARLRIRGEVAHDLSPGDSVSVNGVCLTAATAGDGVFAADVMNQTLSLTTLGTLEREGRVNLEPAVRAGEPLGGHLVQGHVDGTGRVTSVSEDGFARRVAVAVGENLLRYVAKRGSVAIDGVSLTVAGLTAGGLEVSLIPETLERTTLGDLREGSEVNVEVDVVARYAERLVQGLNERKETHE